MSDTTSKIAVFIDAGNLWSSYKKIGKVLDFKTLSSFFAEKFAGEIFKIFHYEAYPKEGTRSADDIQKLHKFFTFLKKGLGYSVVKKPLKTIHLRNEEGDLIYDQETDKPQSIEKGNFDVEIAIDALRYSSAYNIAIFITGDSDFLPLISYLRNLGNAKEVYVFSTEGCISEELRTGTNGYFDLADYSEIHGNNLRNKNKQK